MGAPNTGGVGKKIFDWSRSLRFRRPTVCPLRCADRGICGVINDSRGSRNLMITVMVQLTSIRFVVPGNLMTSLAALYARSAVVERCVYKTALYAGLWWNKIVSVAECAPQAGTRSVCVILQGGPKKWVFSLYKHNLT